MELAASSLSRRHFFVSALPQLSSILLIKALISTRWKPRGGMLRKKTVQVDTAHVAGVRVTPQELTPDTKNYLRETLIFTLQIPPPLPFSSAIRNSICAIVAKIGRSDTASDFPALLPTLLQSLPGNNFTTNCLNKLLKEVSRSPGSRKQYPMCLVCPSLTPLPKAFNATNSSP